jgi:hypothetical protein
MFSELILPDMRLSIVVFPHPVGPRIAVKVFGLKKPEQGFRISRPLSSPPTNLQLIVSYLS